MVPGCEAGHLGALGAASVPEIGDWYDKRIYDQRWGKDNDGKDLYNSPSYKYQVEHYGHPSKVGYKDIIPLWKLENWNPEKLMDLYKKAGAKYFVSMAVHHDNFDLWNSKNHRWNAVAMGPKRDVVAEWKKAAQKNGLRFGVSEHLGASWWWSSNKGSDLVGDKVGVPYDGNDPAFADLYWSGNEKPDGFWYPKNAPASFKQAWFDRIKDLVDQDQPDLLYTDGACPYPEKVS